MKPVDQTKFGKPEGDCFAACVASIFELPADDDTIEAIRREHRQYAIEWDRGEAPSVTKWWDLLEELARLRGFRATYLQDWRNMAPKGYAIASGLGPRELPHSVVTHDGMLAHDPHPDRLGLAAPPDSYVVFIPVLGRSFTPYPDITSGTWDSILARMRATEEIAKNG